MNQPPRFCYVGDTISTTKPMSEFAGSHAGAFLNNSIDTQDAAAEANDRILTGRWHVTRCGVCNENPSLGKCDCK